MKNYTNNYNNNYNRNNYKSNRTVHRDNPIEKFNNNTDDVDINIKRQLVDYVYRNLELSRLRYKLIEYEYDLSLLKEKNYYVSPNYNGIHSLMVFKKINEKYLSYMIDRRTLSYNPSQLDLDKVKMIPFTISLDESIYKGTMFDGVLLYNNIDGKKNFVINDIFYLKGDNLTDNKISNKMLNVSTYLETMKNDEDFNNIIFVVNKLYDLKDIRNLINMYIPKSKYNRSIKGLAFYPETSGSKLIYLYNNCSREEIESEKEKDKEPLKTVTHQPHHNVIERDVPVESISVENNSMVERLVFKMKKTEIIDVYNLYLGQKDIEDNKKVFKYKKVGIAYIPTKDCSFFCRQAFENIKNDYVLVECTYNKDKKRWIPDKLATNVTRPDLLERLN